MKKIFCLFGIVAVLTMSTANVQAQQWNNNNTQGTIVGASIGAIAGALIDRYNPAAGAVVGSLIGAGVGYVASANQNNAYYGQQGYQNNANCAQPVVYQNNGYGNQYNDRRYDRRNRGYNDRSRGYDNDRRNDRRYNNRY